MKTSLFRCVVDSKLGRYRKLFVTSVLDKENKTNSEGALYETRHKERSQISRAISVAYVRQLQNIRTENALEEGKKIHAEISQRRMESDVYVGSSLVSMYIRCGSLIEARQVFDRLQKRDIVSWTAIISGYAKQRNGREALVLFEKMKQEGMKPDEVTFVCMLNACASLADLGQGMKIHTDVMKANFDNNIFVGAALVDMYGKCGNLMRAREVFDKMVQRDCVSWNAMVAGYAKHGCSEQALELFQQMKQEGVKPDTVTYVCLLSAFANSGALEQGKQVHAEIIEAGFHKDVFVGNAIMDMYVKCGSLLYARNLFDQMQSRSVVSWNTMMAGYINCGNAEEALTLYQQMKLLKLKPDDVTLVCVLNACASLGFIDCGKETHADAVKARLESHLFVAAALIDMYLKCGNLPQARQVFDRSSNRDLVCWSVMIAGYVKEGNAIEALSLYQKMKREGVRSDGMTFVCILNACAKLAVLEEGEQVHLDIIGAGVELDIFVGNALIDMYGKCGSMAKAQKVFYKMPTRDIVSWNTMIAGYCLNGKIQESFELFWKMQNAGLKPDDVTFVSLLSVCSRLGLLEEGRNLFERMTKQYGVAPSLEHYGCMVDLFSRAGCLDQAYFFIERMPIPHTAELWKTLLAACRLYDNLKLAECVAEHIFKSEPHDWATFVLLSDMYARARQWGSRAQLISAMGRRGVTK